MTDPKTLDRTRDDSKVEVMPDLRPLDPTPGATRAEVKKALVEPISTFEISLESQLMPALKRILGRGVFAVKALAGEGEDMVVLEKETSVTIAGRNVAGKVRIIGSSLDASGAPRRLVLGFYSKGGFVTVPGINTSLGQTTQTPWISFEFLPDAPVKVTTNTGSPALISAAIEAAPFIDVTDSEGIGPELNFLGNRLLQVSSTFEGQAGDDASTTSVPAPVAGLLGSEMISLGVGDGLVNCTIQVNFESFDRNGTAQVCTVGVRSEDRTHWATLSYSMQRDAVVVGGSDLTPLQIAAIVKAIARFAGISIDHARKVPVRKITRFGTTEATKAELAQMHMGLSTKMIMDLMKSHQALFEANGNGKPAANRVTVKSGEYFVVSGPHMYESVKPRVGASGLETTRTPGVQFQFAPVATPNKIASVFVPTDALVKGEVRFSGRAVNLTLFQEIFLATGR